MMTYETLWEHRLSNVISYLLCHVVPGVYCGSPPGVAHGEYVYVESDVTSLSTVRLECNRGYVANAEDILTCYRDGWSQNNGHCQSKYMVIQLYEKMINK